MKSIGLYHWTRNNKNAVDASIGSFRKYHPDSPIFVVSDHGENLYDICKKHNAMYFEDNCNIGYFKWPWGLNRKQLIRFFTRMYFGAIAMGTTHFVCSEDDIVFVNTIQFDETWEMGSYHMPVTTPTEPARINDEILEACKKVSGVEPKLKYYGCGGGSILNANTFIRNFPNGMQFFNHTYDHFHSKQHQLGWLDCFMQVYYYTAGKDYSVNPRLFQFDPHERPEFQVWPEGFDIDLDPYREKYDIIHNYKKYYSKRTPGNE